MLIMLLPCAALAGPDKALSAAMNQQMQINRQRYGIAGQAVLVMHNDDVLFRGANGDADLDTKERMTTDDVFPVYSLSKLFVSTLIMQLVEQGEVNLDKAASTYLPGLPARWQGITVRQFLNHTSGVPEYFDESHGPMIFPASREAVFSSLQDKPLLFPTGTTTRYTQTNYFVLSALLEAHYGKPYPQIAAERIIRKLHLKHTWLGTASLPKHGVVKSYNGKDGQLRKDEDLVWPTYSFGHSSLYLSPDDAGRFLRAMATGELVGKNTLRQLWQSQALPNGQAGWFAAGWEYGTSGAYRHVGHDGGTKVRVRILFKDSLDGDVYTFVYLTNGSIKNVWSRTLLGSAMAVAAPAQFPAEALSETLTGFALQPSTDKDTAALIDSIRANGAMKNAEIERVVNDTGYAVRANLGVEAAIRVFALNTTLFPTSANAWDSLAEAYEAKGDKEKAKTLYDKAHQLAAESKAAGAARQ
jgi:CubicO group peptidase (beta-lactamase class C family)